jgi:hypothetical protein
VRNLELFSGDKPRCSATDLLPAHTLAQKAKTPSINASIEALNQGSCWRRMGDSNYRPSVLVKTEVGRLSNWTEVKGF